MNFYRESISRTAHSQMHLNKFFTSAKKKDKTPINWDAEAERAFTEFKELVKDLFAMPLIRLWAQLWKYRLISLEALGIFLEKVYRSPNEVRDVRP